MSNVMASVPLMLKYLRLSSIKQHWQPLADKAVAEHWRPEQYLSELCALELASRDDKRLQRYLKEAALPRPASSWAALTSKGQGASPSLISVS